MLDLKDLMRLVGFRPENLVCNSEHPARCGATNPTAVLPRDPVPEAGQESRHAKHGRQHGQDIHGLRLASACTGR